MAEPSKEPVKATEPTKVVEPVKPVEVKLDWPAAELYLKAVKDKVFEYKGKVGYNPFVWWRDNNGLEIEDLIEEGVKTPALHAKIMALKFSEPTVTQPGFVPTPDKR